MQQAIQVTLSDMTYQALKRLMRQTNKTEQEIMEDALQTYLTTSSEKAPNFLGLFADDVELVDRLEEDAMETRKQMAWRVGGLQDG